MRVVIASLLLAAASALAQEGFPLDGTWRGERQAEGAAPVTVVLVMQWDGQNVTGLINPGLRSVRFDSGRLDPADWRVHISARNAAGEPIVIEGELGEIGSYHRTITGTWTEGGRSEPVRFTRE